MFTARVEETIVKPSEKAPVTLLYCKGREAEDSEVVVILLLNVAKSVEAR